MGASVLLIRYLSQDESVLKKELAAEKAKSQPPPDSALQGEDDVVEVEEVEVSVGEDF